MNRIIQLGEHQWQLPEPPTSQEDVFFVKEKRENQYWRRQTDFPKFFFDWDSETKMDADHTLYNDRGDLLSLDRHDSKMLRALRDRELLRRKRGVWFMNDGELTHLTGGHYFTLQWGQMAGFTNKEDGTSYGHYREFQRDLFYFLSMCKQDDNCAGAFILKPKKTGVTQMLALDYLDESTRMRGKIFGMMSKALLDCRDTNFMYYKFALENLPNVMKPSISNQNLTAIIYGNPASVKNTTRKGRSAVNGNLEWLNTRVMALPTKANAFDGPKIFRAWTDELPKYLDPYPQDVYNKTIGSVKLQEVIEGKWWISSYTPEDDSKSYEQAKEIYYQSKMNTYNEKTGRTKSELYAYFINVLDSAEGTFDIYGRADRKQTKIYVENNLEERKNDRDALQAWMRKNPTSEEEAWRQGGGGGSIFNNIRLGARKFDLQEQLRTGLLPYTEGDLQWTGEEMASPVTMVPITDEQKIQQGKEGLFYFYDFKDLRPDAFNLPFVLEQRDERGLLTFGELPRYLTSVDPTDYANAKLVVSGSKNAIYVFNMPDPELNAMRGNRQVSNRKVVEYFYRHDKPSDTFKDVVKLIFFFGSPVLIESNKPWLITMLIEAGLENFILVRDPKNRTIVPYQRNTHQTLIATSKAGGANVIDDYIRAAQEYLAEPKLGDFDNLENISSVGLLDDLMKFDPAETKKFDKAVAFMYGLLGLQSFSAYLQRQKQKNSLYDKGILKRVGETLMDD